MEARKQTTLTIQKSEEKTYQLTKSYTSKLLENNYSPLQVLKESYQNLRIRELDKQEVTAYLSRIITKDISLKNIPENNFLQFHLFCKFN